MAWKSGAMRSKPASRRFIAARRHVARAPRQREHRLPAGRRAVLRILGEQLEQEGRAAAGQARDEDWALDGPGEQPGLARLMLPQGRQVAQEARDVEACGEV